jgi:hypothetical protein
MNEDEDFQAVLILNYPPDDIREIENLVRARDSFVALMTGDLYELMHYLDPRAEFKFFGYLDRNVYSRITSIVSGKIRALRELPDLRWAAAVLAFSQIAEITFDYASSIYELATIRGVAEAEEEVKRFRVADNSNPRLFIDFALGRINQIPNDALADIEHPTDIDPAVFAKRTTDFRIHYIFALKIAQLAQRDIEPIKKMIVLLDWMHSGFMFGSAALLFANRYFSPSRHRRMIKGFSKRGVQNAAWDMTLIHNWRRNALKGAQNNKPAILISGDKALKDIARRVTAESDEESVSHIRDAWGKNSRDGRRIFDHYRRLTEDIEHDSNRGAKIPKYEIQLRMIEELEREVLVPDESA